MGKWSTYQRRSASAATPAGAPPPPAPLLEVSCAGGTPELYWLWEGEDPTLWRAYRRIAPAAWTYLDDIPGGDRIYTDIARECPGADQSLYMVVGCDGGFVEITGRSDEILLTTNDL